MSNQIHWLISGTYSVCVSVTSNCTTWCCFGHQAGWWWCCSDTGWEGLAERLKGKQRLSQWNLICLSAFLVSSLSHPAKEGVEGGFVFYGVYSNAQRVKLFLEPLSLIISSRINTVYRRNFRVDLIKEILHSARARANWLWWQGLDKNQTRSFMHQ